MNRHPEKAEGYDGSADCILKGCESKDHDVWWHKNDKGEVIATTFICRLCGTKNRWGDIIETEPEDPTDVWADDGFDTSKIIGR